MEQKTKKPATKSESIAKHDEGVAPSTPTLETLKSDLDDAIAALQEHSPESALTDSERRRLLGSGVRRYGFIDKVSDFAVANPNFVPPYMDEEELKKLIRQIELLRAIETDLQQLLRMTGDNLLVASDEAYQLALMYYNSVKEAANRRVPGAQAVYRMLASFFKSAKRKKSEPTEKEIERDVKALLHGTKDGEIIIKNENPKTTGGVHEVIDETHKGNATVKETFTENEKI